MRDVEAQVERAQHELSLLRGVMVRSDGKRINGGGGAITALWNASSIPEGPAGARLRAKEKARRKKVAVMGDAETEHLLLAAKTLREKEKREQVRKDRRREEEEQEVQRAVAAAAYPPLERRRHEPQAPPGPARPSTAPGVRTLPSDQRTDTIPRTPDKSAFLPGVSPSPARKIAPSTPHSSHALQAVAHVEAGGYPMAHPSSAPRHAPPLAGSPQRWLGPAVSAPSFRPDPYTGPAVPSSPAYGYTPSQPRSAGGAYAQSGINGLLQAAQLVTPGGTRVEWSELHKNTEISASPKRRRVISSTPKGGREDLTHAVTAGGAGAFESPSRSVAPAQPVMGVSGSGNGNGGGGPTAHPVGLGGPIHTRTQSNPPVNPEPREGLSALDMLADQAAASQHPSQTSDWSGNSGTDEDALDRKPFMHPPPFPRPTMYGPPPGYHLPGPPLLTAPPHFYPHAPYPPPPPFPGSYEPPPPPPRRRGTNSSASSAGASGSVSRGGGQARPSEAAEGGSPAKKGRKHDPSNPSVRRVPYIRWTEPEDRKLRAAIKEYGQRWELISRAVGTRSYHQCRQRYLLMRRKEAAQQGHSLANHPRLDADRVGPYYDDIGVTRFPHGLPPTTGGSADAGADASTDAGAGVGTDARTGIPSLSPNQMDAAASIRSSTGDQRGFSDDLEAEAAGWSEDEVEHTEAEGGGETEAEVGDDTLRQPLRESHATYGTGEAAAPGPEFVGPAGSIAVSESESGHGPVPEPEPGLPVSPNARPPADAGSTLPFPSSVPLRDGHTDETDLPTAKNSERTPEPGHAETRNAPGTENLPPPRAIEAYAAGTVPSTTAGTAEYTTPTQLHASPASPGSEPTPAQNVGGKPSSPSTGGVTPRGDNKRQRHASHDLASPPGGSPSSPRPPPRGHHPSNPGHPPSGHPSSGHPPSGHPSSGVSGQARTILAGAP